MGPRFRLRNMLQALIVFCLSLFQRMQILHQLSALQIPSSSLKLIFSIHSLLFRSIHTRTHRYIHVCVCVCPHIIHMLYMCQIVLFVSTLGDTSKPQKATKMLSNTFFQNFSEFSRFCVQNKIFNFTSYNAENHLPQASFSEYFLNDLKYDFCQMSSSYLCVNLF